MMKKAYILGKIFYTLEIIVILLTILFTIFPVGAEAATGTVQAGTDFTVPIHNIGEYMTAFFAWGVPLLGSLAVLMFIYAGYLYMTSQGNQENISTAKEIMTATILGILVLFTAELLLRQVIGTGGIK